MTGATAEIARGFSGLGKGVSHNGKDYIVASALYNVNGRDAVLVNLTDKDVSVKFQCVNNTLTHNGQTYDMYIANGFCGIYQNEMYVVAKLFEQGSTLSGSQADTTFVRGMVVLKGLFSNLVDSPATFKDQLTTVRVILTSEDLTYNGYTINTITESNPFTGGTSQSDLLPNYAGEVVGDKLVLYQFGKTIGFMDLTNTNDFKFYSYNITTANKSIQENHKLIINKVDYDFQTGGQNTKLSIGDIPSLIQEFESAEGVNVDYTINGVGSYEWFDIEPDKFIEFDHTSATSKQPIFETFDNTGTLLSPQPGYSVLADSLATTHRNPAAHPHIDGIYSFMGMDGSSGEAVAVATINNGKLYIVYTSGVQLTYRL